MLLDIVLLRKHQHAHCGERQPEPGLLQGPRIEHGDHAGRSQQHQRPRPAQAGAAQEHHHAQHPHGALCRHAPARQHRIAGRSRETAPQRGARRGQPQRRTRTAPPDGADQRAGTPGEHGHVQTADAHQMGDASAAKQIPVVTVDRRLVAHRQRSEHAGGSRVAHLGLNRIAHVLAPALHRVGRGALDQPGRRRIAHRSARAHALLERLQLQIEAVRVQQSVWPTQPRRELPALAGTQFTLQYGGCGIALKALVPPQMDARRQRHGTAVKHRLLDIKAKALAVGTALRQAGHHAGDLHLAPFEVCDQQFGFAHRSTQAGQAEGQQRQAQHGRRPPPAKPQGQQHREHADQGDQPIVAWGLQAALLQLHRHTERPGQPQTCQTPAGVHDGEWGGQDMRRSVGFQSPGAPVCRPVPAYGFPP